MKVNVTVFGPDRTSIETKAREELAAFAGTDQFGNVEIEVWPELQRTSGKIELWRGEVCADLPEVIE